MQHGLGSERTKVALICFSQETTKVSRQLGPTLRTVSVRLKACRPFVVVVEQLGARSGPIERVKRIGGVIWQQSKKVEEVRMSCGGVLVIKIEWLELRVKELGAEEHCQQVIHLVNYYRMFGVFNCIIYIGVDLERGGVVNFEGKTSCLKRRHSRILRLDRKKTQNVMLFVNQHGQQCLFKVGLLNFQC